MFQSMKINMNAILDEKNAFVYSIHASKDLNALDKGRYCRMFGMCSEFRDFERTVK